MLKLKKIHILGFKSFCDRTELTVPGTGIAVVVGPNGCGKSNILDGVSWVLGEQSAKTLRGTHMQDVIFAGTRERKPLGMAEVTLTMVDPEAYEGPIPVEPDVVVDHDGPADWDENELRRQNAVEAEEIISAEQPGQVLEDDGPEQAQVAAKLEGAEGPQAVVLKIRRRKFNRTPQRGEIVITRRLFRTGESEYLLNGKLCRLRDIQDIFMGTGLGPESYAIIGQERIGQLLSSKPHDRRAIIEEAAGITRFKNKKRLAELRLESAKQNLARVDDIFEEVTRQMNSLKRQASKAERFVAVWFPDPRPGRRHRWTTRSMSSRSPVADAHLSAARPPEGTSRTQGKAKLRGLFHPSHARALRNICIHGESSPHSRGRQDICTERKTRSGCGIRIV